MALPGSQRLLEWGYSEDTVPRCLKVFNLPSYPEPGYRRAMTFLPGDTPSLALRLHRDLGEDAMIHRFRGLSFPIRGGSSLRQRCQVANVEAPALYPAS